MAQPVQKQSRVWVWAIVALAAVIAVYVWYRSAQPSATVLTAAVTRQDITRTVSANGQVEPTQDFQAHASGPGIVSRLLVQVGQQVVHGQPLVEMDAADARERVATAQATLAGDELALHNMQGGGSQADLMSQRNDLASAESQLHQASATLAALQKLQAQGAASANEVGSAQQKVSDAQMKVSQLQAVRTGKFGAADLQAQRALVSEAQAGLAAATSAYAGVDIRSPFAGTVYAIPVTQYESVQSGALLLQLADLSKLQVKAYFDEPEIGNLAAGQPVSIVWDARPNRTWHGHILRPPTTITTYGTRNVGECLITVDDANGDLLPNTNVTG